MTDSEILLRNIHLLGEPSTWQDCLQAVEAGMAAWLRGSSEFTFRRIAIVGCGTSYYAARVGKYLIERFTHLPVEAHQAYTYSIYTDPALFREALVVGISTTGNTISVCEALQAARQAGAMTLAFTAEAGSRITQIAHSTILTGGRVTIAVKTETYLQSLICLYLFGLHLGRQLGVVEGREVERWYAQIQTAQQVTRTFLDEGQAEIEALVERYAAADMVFVIGSGPNFGTAEEASLKIVEIAKMYSASQELENFLHGYDREVNSNSPLFLISPQGQAVEKMLDLLAFTHKVGVPTVVLANQENYAARRVADHILLLEGQLEELATPLIYIAPFYLFGYQMALRRGYDPSERRYPGVFPLKIRYRDEFGEVAAG